MKKKPIPPLIKDLATLGLALGAQAILLETKNKTNPDTKLIMQYDADRNMAWVLKGICVALDKVMSKHYTNPNIK